MESSLLFIVIFLYMLLHGLAMIVILMKLGDMNRELHDIRGQLGGQSQENFKK